MDKKVKATETIIPATAIATGEYSLNTVFPTTTIQYPRNGFGTAIIDANQPNIENSRLVVNLVGQRFIKSRFETIIATEFEEFLDPESQEFEEIAGAAVADLSAELASKNNQLDSANKKIKALLNTNQQLQNELGNINTISATDTSDQVNQALAALSNQPDNTKGRIFSDGTLLIDRDRREYYYIIEDGKKRWFWFNRDLALAAAKAFGKIIPNTDEVDWIEVPQYILDRIPSGANFEAEDLVKNKKTPAPEPLVLPNGQRVVAQWITDQNPIIIKTTKIGKQTNLTIPLSIKYTTDTGIINLMEVWDDTYRWTESKPQLPIKRTAFGDVDWKKDKIMGYWGPDTTDKFDLLIKDTSYPLTGTNNNSNSSGTAYIKRFTDISVTRENPVKELVLRAKLFSDTMGVGNSDKLIVRIELQPEPMPNVIGDKFDAFLQFRSETQPTETEIRHKGITNEIKYIKGPIASADNLSFVIYEQSVPPGTALSPTSTDIIELTYYAPNKGRIPVDYNRDSYDYSRLKNQLRIQGFTNFIINYRLSTYQTDNYKVYSINQSSNVINTGQQSVIPLKAGDVILLSSTIIIDVLLWNNATSKIEPSYTYGQLATSNNSVLVNKIYTELNSI